VLDILRSQSEVRARGVALARGLTASLSGPLAAEPSEATLQQATAEIIGALRGPRAGQRHVCRAADGNAHCRAVDMHPAHQIMNVTGRLVHNASRSSTIRHPLARGRGRPASLRCQLRVHWHRLALDRELAAGREPEENHLLADRAGQLIARDHRHKLAVSVRRLVAEAESPRIALSAAVPLCRTTIGSWREALLGLADRLDAAAPLRPCGVARALILLTDGTGPVYHAGAHSSLGEMVWWIADGLELPPPRADACRCAP
jgi:hypothetical protein